VFGWLLLLAILLGFALSRVWRIHPVLGSTCIVGTAWLLGLFESHLLKSRFLLSILVATLGLSLFASLGDIRRRAKLALPFVCFPLFHLIFLRGVDREGFVDVLYLYRDVPVVFVGEVLAIASLLFCSVFGRQHSGCLGSSASAWSLGLGALLSTEGALYSSVLVATASFHPSADLLLGLVLDSFGSSVTLLSGVAVPVLLGFWIDRRMRTRESPVSV